MIDSLYTWDLAITKFIYEIIPHNVFFDRLFELLSQGGGSIFFWAAILILLIVFEEKKDRGFLLPFVVSVGGAYLLVNYFLKDLFARPRPDFLTISSTYICPTNFAFPSGHAAVAFAAAVILSTYDKKRRYWYYSLAILISLSRIYLGCHFFLDVAGGALIGFATSLVVLKILPSRRGRS